MAIIAVTYVYGGDAQALTEHRPRHRDFLRELLAEGSLVLAGPYDDDLPAGALLLMRAETPEAALELLAPDPLLEVGVITERTARPWKISIGQLD
ncbi:MULTISPECIES: YciI family protein [Kocuria]|uniref:YciI family protein n=1 Tax=Kocuria TaxID=57493 RepID=UPI000738DD66|nr:YciI family protein [Kocuria palustris]KUG53912.1 hypothetical protein AVL60_05010 [Kocuria palustris]